ncbi:hypothetical protein LguiB_035738 [Lonicera macranthoides]
MTSTDLQFRPEFLEIRLPSIKITSTSQLPSDNNSATIQTEADSDECHTPKSPKNMIPKILNCPPPPRKQRPVASCKRKLEFFETVAREEVESFFRSSFERIDFNSQAVIKRRCPCK